MNDQIAILMLLLIQRQRRKKAISFRQKLSAEGRKRRDRRISRAALQHPSMSTFSVLFGSGCDRSLITLTGLDHQAFRRLLEKFAPAFERCSPYCAEGMIRRLPLRSKKRGRPRSLSACHCLGLILSWGRSRGSEMVLCLMFGITGSVCSLFLRFGRRILLHQLCKDDMAAVRMPSDEEVKGFQHSFASKYSLLSDVYAVADGLKIYLQQSGDSVIQNMFYNGWTHDHYVGNVFVFAPNGAIIACAVNAPGAMHDSTIADWGNIYKKLEDVYDRTGGRCVVDSAFAKGNHPFLIKSSQDYLINAEHVDQVAEGRQATSARQAAEWGMRALQGSFPRLKDRLTYEERGERKSILLSLILLFNFRTRLVGMNQILNTYMPNMSADANYFLQNNIGLPE